ncbi:putative Uncharacterized protein family (UPF0139) [Monocercomonoides exilis]|uniref:putative Uncharacterized protein family (UPF0139) n=1 Tax=Monocercomonoides exilis TaxID=2049356 RepID=UPI0035598C3E|nr:putative Uncharacterized protein family (UPF0139) [Monocercomonoides exilis]|eukprot:MONOS_1769.1-p1 / transcript=MONOS_1769.1 / gene=MONOS_1769 / organism=Monocercomonoides_exilis_PA203 / gene_product=unspecified product / transcript_product=unspecified product / location=Mono_scaffold00033:49157-49642(+) / protein_length=106 / sequence_SO=supercontig / SO=protein_coding / is_pseudo=false
MVKDRKKLKQPEKAVPFCPNAPIEQESVYSLMAMMFSVLGMTMKLRWAPWFAILCMVISISKAKFGGQFDRSQHIMTLVLSLISMFFIYFTNSKNAPPVKSTKRKR